MNAVLVRFYLKQSSRHAGIPLYEWLLQEAKRQGAAGATAFHALAGFGRHGWHEAHFFELAEQPVAVEVIAEPAIIARLVAAIGAAGLELPYLDVPVTMRITGQTDQSAP
ncbi:DUF190 domain-containing protein [Chitinolyticbacter albus]|uniref:DUF190 domain-containing protein n=1 Tax=Chitinolyticbacter albus TaxID=2961951 RepID=UPI00210948AD|nr:DUF190 domain-containing protein [Chitinolyticbacter albus]